MTTAVQPGAGLLPVYPRRDAVFAAGMGCRLFAEDGREFLDFTSGIGVNSLGYGHPVVVEALQEAASTGLVHVSNLFRSGPGEALADLLCERSFADAVFFTNSGAEATEAALKFARRYTGSERTDMVAVHGSFHGRTFGALSVTDRPAIQDPFRPLVPGARFIPIDASDAQLAEAIHANRTAAVIVEPVQGEGGIRPVDAGMLRRLRDRCTETGVPLIFDEIQCGLGRTGTLFASEQTGVVPDMLLLAKPIASGFPMGAVLLAEPVAGAIQPGDHATTFGGGPFVAHVACATVRALADAALLEDVRRRGEHVSERLAEMQRHVPGIRDVRGRGLMWGIELEDAAGPIADRAYDAGLLVLTAGPNVVRLLPPLTISERDLDHGLSLLADAIR